MKGLEVVCRAVADTISRDIVDRLGLLVAEHGPVQPVGGDPTPAVVFWTMREIGVLAADEWPLVQVIGQGAPTLARGSQVDARGIAYEVRYRLRVLSMVRGSGYEETAALRSRLALAVREVLLARQLLEDDLRLDETKLSESYSDVAYDPGDERNVAGAYLDLELVAREVLAPRVAALGATAITVRAAPAG